MKEYFKSHMPLFYMSGLLIFLSMVTVFQAYKEQILISIFIVIPIHFVVILYIFSLNREYLFKDKIQKFHLYFLLIINLYSATVWHYTNMKISFFYYVLASLFAYLIAVLFTKFSIAIKDINTYISDKIQVLFKRLVMTFFVYIFILLIFSALYQALLLYEPESYKGLNIESSFVEFIYFSTVTITTLGYGDISPITTMSKILVMIESLIGIFMLSILIGITISISLKNEKN